MKTSTFPGKSESQITEGKKSPSKEKFLFPGVKIGVVIPAYNEELNIGNTIEQIPENISDKFDVIIVDDGSEDNTAEVIQSYEDVILVKHPHNRGNGAATKTGLNYCKREKYDIAVILDADGQHNPKYLKDFIEPILQENYDFAIGNRFKFYYDMNYKKKFFSKLMTAFYFILLRKQISDPTNGYRALSSTLLKDINFESNYSLTQEMLFKIIPNYKYKNIPIKLEQRNHGQSFIKIRKYLQKIILLIIKFYIFAKISVISRRIFSYETRKNVANLIKT